MIFSMGLSAAAAINNKFLAFTVTEYASEAYRADNNVTKLSLIAFNLAKGMASANCTFNWTDGTIGKTSAATDLHNKYQYISHCHENTVAATDPDYYFNGTV